MEAERVVHLLFNIRHSDTHEQGTKKAPSKGLSGASRDLQGIYLGKSGTGAGLATIKRGAIQSDLSPPRFPYPTIGQVN